VWKSKREVNPKVSRFDGVATLAECQWEQMEQAIVTAHGAICLECDSERDGLTMQETGA
jgi:hypothetical protein